MNSLDYLDSLENEIIPHSTYEMLSSLNLFTRGSAGRPAEEQTPTEKAERGIQTDPNIEEAERMTWQCVVNEIKRSQEPNAKIHATTNTNSDQLLPAILDRGVLAALTGDDKELKKVRQAVMSKKAEDENRLDKKWKQYLREVRRLLISGPPTSYTRTNKKCHYPKTACRPLWGQNNEGKSRIHLDAKD